MRRRMMKSKIHRATVTDANLHYVGSITLDTKLMEQADILDWEQVTVVDIDNGARFETYAIPGGDGDVCLNGAAARLVHPGDRIIVITYADYEDSELDEFALGSSTSTPPTGPSTRPPRPRWPRRRPARCATWRSRRRWAPRWPASTPSSTA